MISKTRTQTLREKINSTFFDSKSARYTDGEQPQTCLAFPLLLDVVPAGHRERVQQNLLDDITQQRGGHLDFGVLGSACTLAALVREGRSDLIYRMATSQDWPGWGHMVNQGATTPWEHWLPGDRIPPNTTAIVQSPAAHADAVRESGRPATEANGVRLLRADEGTVEFEVSSGDYCFVVESNR